ncbi:siderophore [Aspergillus brasiliensis]|uniref:Siderophore n=1 Tax=Aspergillus brasiliensis TaxID=319629 RepID=A0A9W5YJQ8_9EURO|nr:siderophore [Aspergillus brasiliensis]GKZ43411.1 siderophore [Aspergillus brasiliensis]
MLQTIGIVPDPVRRDESRESTTYSHPLVQQTLNHLSTVTGSLPASSLSPNRRQALFETTKRVLASAINDGLASTTIETSHPSSLLLRLRSPDGALAGDEKDTWIECGMRADAYVEKDGGRVLGFVRADDLLAPVLIQNSKGQVSEELDPGVICRIICRWRSRQDENDAVEMLVKEVQNSANNQEKWLEMASTMPILDLKSSLCDWEQSLVTGHPTHPLHRACLAQSPLKPIAPEDIPELLEPEISFICVPKSEIKVFGPFQSLLDPLLESLGISKPDDTVNEIVVPCFSRQLPSITPLFPKARILGAVQNRCRAQISMRTVSMMPDVGYPLHLKLSLNCQITSGPRTITPWTAALGPALGKVLQKLLPPNLWIFEEVASITGGQEDFDQARHLTCIIRKSPEQRAAELGETIIPVAGLHQKPFNDDRTYMEIIFGLDDLQKKQEWFRKYISQLFSLILPPLVRYGIGLESHSQNILVRINIARKEVTGFAVRDFGGIRIHHPTLLRRSEEHNNLSALLPPGCHNLTDDILDVWHKVHHALLQVHVGHLLYMLGLESQGGWPIVREELKRALHPDADPDGRLVYDFLLRDTMSFKCFMEMRLLGVYRDYYERELPNILLRDA